jgi:peptidyl-tRNA hydrolase
VESEPTQVGKPTAAGVIPDFATDNAALAEYEAIKERYQKSAISQAESAVRASYSKKRAGALGEIKAAADVLEERRVAADEALKAYGAAFPARVHGNQIERPGFFEALLSFGRASKLYNAAEKTAGDVLDATAIYRRRQRFDEDLDAWLRRSLARAAAEVKQQCETPDWLAKFHANAEVAQLWTRVQAIRSERDAYETRLKAGQVSPEEQRVRFVGQNKVASLRVPFEAIMIDGILHFGDTSIWSFIDLNGNRFWLPYDHRSWNLVDSVFDAYRVVDELKTKFTQTKDGRRFTPADHFIHRLGDEAEGRDAARKRTEALKGQKPIARDAAVSDPEDKKMLDALARLALTLGVGGF